MLVASTYSVFVSNEALPETVRPVSVPTEVNDEAVTPEANVEPLRSPAAPLVPAGPCGPVAPVAPVAPVEPVGPSLKTKSNVAALDEPLLVTDAVPEFATELIEPTAIVAAAPAAPVAP